MVFVWCGSGPVFCCFRCFLCWRNANLAGRFAGRRCCRFLFVLVVFVLCLGCEAKEFHIFCTLFYRFSHCQDRALERDRPQQREKKSAPGACGEPCFCVVFAFLAWPCTGSPKVQAILHGFGTSAKKRLPVRLTELAQYGWVGGWGPRYLAHKRERGPARVPRLLSEGKSASAR